MANRTICEFFAPSTANVATGHDVINVDTHFELKPALIMMVQASPFYGKSHEDANAHLQHFLQIYSSFTIKGVTHPRGHTSSSFPLLFARKSEIVVLLKSQRCRYMGKVFKCFPSYVLLDG